MTRTQLSAAVALASSPESLASEDTAALDGFALPGFRATCTLRQLAAVVRWQCYRLDGVMDAAALAEIAAAGRTIVVV